MRRPPCLPTLFLILLAASTPLAATDAPTGRASAALATSATPLVHAVPELPAPPPRVARERAPSGVTVLVRSTGADARARSRRTRWAPGGECRNESIVAEEAVRT